MSRTVRVTVSVMRSTGGVESGFAGCGRGLDVVREAGG
jgi:hypothetical protein